MFRSLPKSGEFRFCSDMEVTSSVAARMLAKEIRLAIAIDGLPVRKKCRHEPLEFRRPGSGWLASTSAVTACGLTACEAPLWVARKGTAGGGLGGTGLTLPSARPA